MIYIERKGADLFRLELEGVLNRSVPFCSSPFVHSRMYVFAATSSGVLYAFDVGNNWSIVEIDSEIDEVAVLADNFSSFIRNQLIVVKGYVDWRAEQ